MKKTQIELAVGNNREYKVKVIWNNTVYRKKTRSYLLRLYYLDLYRKYSKKENI